MAKKIREVKKLSRVKTKGLPTGTQIISGGILYTLMDASKPLPSNQNTKNT